MHIADIDYLSIYGDSPIHKITATAKVIFSLLLLTSIILSASLIKLALISILLIALYKKANLSLSIARIAIYPAFFAIIFALLMSRQGITHSFIVMFKAVNAALTMIFLITTTPYVEIFSIMGKFLPNLLVDVFLITYRSFFILLEKISNLLRTVKVKGGYRPHNFVTNIKTIAAVLGTLILQAIDMSERMYKILELRGYNGKIPVEANFKISQKADYILIVGGLIILIGVILPWNIL
jgi:cobalt/nickel transport system permease protein